MSVWRLKSGKVFLWMVKILPHTVRIPPPFFIIDLSLSDLGSTGTLFSIVRLGLSVSVWFTLSATLAHLSSLFPSSIFLDTQPCRRVWNTPSSHHSYANAISTLVGETHAEGKLGFQKTGKSQQIETDAVHYMSRSALTSSGDSWLLLPSARSASLKTQVTEQILSKLVWGS